MFFLDTEKKISCVLVSILLMFLCLFPLQSFAEVGIEVEVSRNSVQQGDEITCRAGISGSWDQAVDIYLALLKPLDSSIYYMGPDLQFTKEKVAIVKGWEPFAFDNVDLSNFSFNESDIEGEYIWCGVLTYAGKDLFEEGSILPGAVSVAPFIFSKSNSDNDSNAGIVSWLPQEGNIFYTTEPEFFLKFSKPVNKDFVEKKIEVTLKSLSSGKIVSVKCDENGERWATAVLPDLGTISQKIEDNEFISQAWSENDTKIVYKIQSFTVYGQTFALHSGVTYQVTFHLKSGAVFADGINIPEKILGPITFSVD